MSAIFKARASGASLQECADKLERATGKGWSRSTLKRMFGSVTYLGHISIGADIYKEDAHPALVDERTWQLAQREGMRPAHDGSLASQGILAGLIRCDGCGHVLTIIGSGPPGERFASYACRKRRASGVCPAPASATVDKVDAVVRPGIEERSTARTDFGVYMEATDASSVAFERAVAELDAFLEGASIADLGAELYNREVARRRESVTAARATWERDAAQGAALLRLGETTGLEHDRAQARQALEGRDPRQVHTGALAAHRGSAEVVWR